MLPNPLSVFSEPHSVLLNPLSAFSEPHFVLPNPPSVSSEPQSIPGPTANHLPLQVLCEKVNKLPKTIPLANKTHPLASYSHSPKDLTLDILNDADIWETWDQKLNVLLQHPIDNIKPLVVRGKFGLVGLVSFFEHLVRDCHLDKGLLEGKVEWLIMVIDRYIYLLQRSHY